MDICFAAFDRAKVHDRKYAVGNFGLFYALDDGVDAPIGIEAGELGIEGVVGSKKWSEDKRKTKEAGIHGRGELG